MVIQIRIQPDPALLKVLTALDIPWEPDPGTNGGQGWAVINVSDSDDRRLLDIWNRLTDLRFVYLDYRQRHDQPLLPGFETAIEGGDG